MTHRSIIFTTIGFVFRATILSPRSSHVYAQNSPTLLIIIDGEILFVEALFKEADAEVVKVKRHAHVSAGDELLPGLARRLRAVDALDEEGGAVVCMRQERFYVVRPIITVGKEKIGYLRCTQRLLTVYL